jgi:hypothetical protein
MHLVLHNSTFYRIRFNYSDRLASAISVLELAGRLRSGLSAHGAARPALIHQHSDSPSTDGRADRRLPEMADARPCRLWPWDLGRWEYSLRFGTPGANAMVDALAFPFCSTLCSTQGSRSGRRAAGATPP